MAWPTFVRRWVARVGVVTTAAGLLAGCAAEEPGVLVPPPPTERREVIETLHDVEIRDGYRWLEDQAAPETRAWIDAQNGYADTLLKPLPGRDELETLAATVLEVDAIGLPSERGGRYFYSRRQADQDLPVLYVREGPNGEDRILIDPHPMSPDHTISVSYLDISRDGRLVVYAVRAGGVDEVSIHLRDVDTGKDLDDMLPAARYGQVNLTPDKTGFYYERFGDVPPRVMFHALGTEPGSDTRLFGDGYELHQIPVSLLSDDGRWLLVHVIEGSSGPTEIHLKDLTTPAPFTTLIKDGVSESWGAFAGDQLVITTNLGRAEQTGDGGGPGRPHGRPVARDHPRAGGRRHPGRARAWRPAVGVVSAGCPATYGDPRAVWSARAGHHVRDARVCRRRRRALDERRGVFHLPSPIIGRTPSTVTTSRAASGSSGRRSRCRSTPAGTR